MLVPPIMSKYSQGLGGESGSTEDETVMSLRISREFRRRPGEEANVVSHCIFADKRAHMKAAAALR